jgi:probable DNA metabolism protein
MTETVEFDGTFIGWRRAAGELLRKSIPPDQLYWPDPYSQHMGLFESVPTQPSQNTGVRPRNSSVSSARADAGVVEKRTQPTVPKKAWQQLLLLAGRVCYARHADRYNLLYRIAWRMRHGEPHLTDALTDRDMLEARKWDAAVRRDAHKTKAFVRFRLIYTDSGTGLEHFAAWHRPTQYPLRIVGSFFADRFAAVRWTIFTPNEIAFWDGRQVHYQLNDLNVSFKKWDNIESLWQTYYAHIFNPARLNVRAMQREMPKQHWDTLPEAAILPDLISTAHQRATEMQNHIDDIGSLNMARRSRAGQMATGPTTSAGQS